MERDKTVLTAAEIQTALSADGISLTDQQAKMLAAYYEATTAQNEVINLTAITEPKAFLYKHYADSYSIYRESLFSSATKGLDLGTGGGFPGVPMAIYTPHISWTLLDATAKKLRFIEKTVASMGMTNVKTLHGRAEDIGRHRKYRERFDVVVSRAVAALPVLLEWGLPLVRVGGCFIAMKGPRAEEEMALARDAIKILGAEITEVYTKTLSGTEETRTVLFLTKVEETPKKYPRKVGLAVKKPIRIEP